MVEQVLAFSASTTATLQIRTIAQGMALEVSTSTNEKSSADAFDSPIGGGEIKDILQLTLVAFQAATAGFALLLKVRDWLKEQHTAGGQPVPVVVRNPGTGATVGVITQNTPDDQIAKMMKP